MTIEPVRRLLDEAMVTLNKRIAANANAPQRDPIVHARNLIRDALKELHALEKPTS